MPMISSEVRESRLPVGSSARRIAGIGDQGAGDRDALLLAAGELRRIVAFAAGEADAVRARLRARRGAARPR